MADSKHDYVWLVTDREYSDFALRLKFQAYRDSPGNSGVLDDEVHRNRNVGLRGHIALQIHTGDRLRIRFKDIFVKDLPPADQ